MLRDTTDEHAVRVPPMESNHFCTDAPFASSQLPTTRRRTFIALSFQALAIVASVCFHDSSNANTEEVHMKIHSTNRQMPMPCATVAADNRTLLG
jgi:hypothetical protein